MQIGSPLFRERKVQTAQSTAPHVNVGVKEEILWQQQVSQKITAPIYWGKGENVR